jgi:putative tryptophan/tyrosine transport system substrate-binding protein
MKIPLKIRGRFYDRKQSRTSLREQQEQSMRKYLFAILFLVVFLNPSLAGAAYRIEILQAGRSAHFEETYKGIISGLVKNGLPPGADLRINRTVIDVNPATEPYTWENLRVLMKIKKTADEIVQRKPDLVITLGTPATKFARLKIVGAGIPLVFSCVAEPEVVGCTSKTESGPGFTGATMYADPAEILRTALKGLPELKKIGVIHSDDDYASFYADEIIARAGELGLEVVSKEVNLFDRVAPAAEEMISQGVSAFFIPMDRYYRLKNSENAKALMKISSDRKIPCIASVSGSVKGALVYTTPDYRALGSLAADQAARILTKGVKPESIPVARLENQGVLVDAEAFRKLGLTIPPQLLSRSPKPVNDHS